jgi:SAM-dependent methyltransferase
METSGTSRCTAPLLLADMSVKHCSGNARVLDVGCSVGGVSFKLLESFDEMTGVAISAQFIDTARSLRKGGSLPYRVIDEGDIGRVLLAHVTAPADSSRIQFRQADACSLPSEYVGFDAVLATCSAALQALWRSCPGWAAFVD